jgi:hypothetical protein
MNGQSRLAVLLVRTKGGGGGGGVAAGQRAVCDGSHDRERERERDRYESNEWVAGE